MTVRLGIDLGGTLIKAGLFSDEGELGQRRTAPTEDGSGNGSGEPGPVFPEVVRNLIAELETAAGKKAARIGLSAPGLVSRDGHGIAVMPARLQGLAGLDWQEFLGREVCVLNDGHAALLGEVWQGAARGLSDVILLTLGTGVGGGILVDGRLLRGRLGRAGHFGHLCLDPWGAPTIARMPGGLENWIGNHNVLERTGGRFATTPALVAAWLDGDPEASAIWLRSVRALGCAIASLINVLDPEAVLLGGGIAAAGKPFFHAVQQVLDETEWRPAGQTVRLLPAQLGEWAGCYGAAWNAIP